MAYERLFDPAKSMHVEVLDIRYECFLSLFFRFWPYLRAYFLP